MQNLDIIPRGIKHCILHFLTDPRDLYNLNLTCQELRHNALPFYYIPSTSTSMSLCRSWPLDWLLPTPGCNISGTCHDPIKCQQCPMHPNTDLALTLLANLLPHDRLLTFTCDSLVPLSSPILATFHRRQAKLRTLRLDSIDLEPVVSRANIATLYLCTSDPDEASSWNRVLPTLPNLRNLELAATRDLNNGPYPLNADAPSDVLTKLLDWKSQESQYKLHLHTLQVQGFELADAAETLRRSINFAELKVLGMQLCENSIRLVEVLHETHEPIRLSLRTLMLVETEQDPASQANNPALSRLLGTFSTLENLIVKTKGSAAYWPDFAAVAGHAASLRLLHLDCLIPPF
ncbi:hypothetical protein D0859_10944 [Hortaea werneckii]|uniref:Uncharacterized protein n=1 Tax=Hortaea werneckii TaxID=91943 RepID=A0A3M7IHR2_HORWE|nr:hypothetical protein D0859_10944 [Hortaea werneckii]